MGVTVDFNFIAVLIAAILYFGLGAIWYSPVLFAKPWMAEIGKSEEDLKSRVKPWIYGVAFLFMLFSSFVLVHLIKLADKDANALTGLVTSFWICLGIIIPTTGTTALFSGKSLRLYLIDNCYHIVGFLIMGVILGQFG